MVVHTFHPNTWEAKAGGSLWGQPVLQRESQDNQGYTEKEKRKQNKELQNLFLKNCKFITVFGDWKFQGRQSHVFSHWWGPNESWENESTKAGDLSFILRNHTEKKISTTPSCLLQCSLWHRSVQVHTHIYTQSLFLSLISLKLIFRVSCSLHVHTGQKLSSGVFFHHYLS